MKQPIKIFLSHFLYFISLCIILFISIDLLLSKYLAYSKNLAIGDIHIWKHIYDKNDKKYDIAIYGSSRAEVHFDPEIISSQTSLSTYNYGLDGHEFYLQYFRHLELLNNNKKPKYIILQVDAISLKKRNDLYNYEQFLPFMFGDFNTYQYLKTYKGFTLMDYIIPLYRYRGKSDLIFKRILLPNDNIKINGYLPKNEKWNKDLDILLEKQKTPQKSIMDEFSKNLFEKFIKECKINNIKLILVYSPEYKEGVEKVISNRADFIDYYKNISKRENIPFLDYTEDTISYDKKYFYNSTHLNNIGSKLFSEKFSKDLNQIIK